MVKRKDKKTKNTSSSWQKYGLVLTLILFLLAALAFVWAYNNYKESQKVIQDLKSNQNQITQDKKEELINKVKEHMILPEENPAVITIKDPEKLAKKEKFFNKAKSGDTLLLYNSKAILYRSESDKIVDVQPVTTAENEDGRRQIQENEQNQVINVEVRNGGAEPGSASELGNSLDQQKIFNTVEVRDAVTTTYENNILVDNNEQKDITNLEQAVGIEAVSEFPANAVTSTADAVIFLTN